jgi:hypothetical protein
MRFALLSLLAAMVLPAAEIPQGSHVLLRLMNSISTRTARPGDYVYMQTATPIVSDGRVLVPQGSYVQGVVSAVQRSGRVKGRAELGLRIETLTTPSGKVIRMAPRLASIDDEGSEQRVDDKEGQVKQGGSKDTDAVRVATLGGTGAAIGGMADRSWKGAGIGAGIGGGVGLASVLLSRGKEVELKQGSTVDVVFERPIPVD